MSDKWLYNCRFTFHPTELKEFMWAVPYRAISKLLLYQQSPRVLTLFVNKELQREVLKNEIHIHATKTAMMTPGGHQVKVTDKYTFLHQGKYKSEWSTVQFQFLLLLSFSNLFRWHCLVLLLSKTSKTSLFFFNVINIF